MSYTANKFRYENRTYLRCGNSGLLLPPIALGLWKNFGQENDFDTVRTMCRTAFDNGITYFDLANNYGIPSGSAEENFGKILTSDFLPYRDEMIISTKAGYRMQDGPYGAGGSRKYLLSSLDASLTRLGIPYVDIFYHHCPDPATPLEETMDALCMAVSSGKALYVGLSNYDGATMKRASAILEKQNCPFIINQNCYNLLDRTVEKNGLKTAAEEGAKGLAAFSPLSRGLLTNRYIRRLSDNSGTADQRTPLIRRLYDLSVERGEPLSAMAIGWLLKKGVTSVIIGASSPEQILENLKGLESAPFSDEELSRIDTISKMTC